MTRLLLLCLPLFPVLYFLTLAAGSAANPGYSDLAQMPSDLGRTSSALHGAFNAGLVFSGCLGILAGAGLASGLAAGSGAHVLAWAAGMSWGVFALSLVVAGLFPLPSPYHTAGGLVFAGILTPILAALALKSRPDARLVRSVLFGAFLLVGALVASALTGLVNDRYGGLLVRGLAVIMFGSTAFLGVFLLRKHERA